MSWHGMLLRIMGFGSVKVVERDSGKDFVEKVRPEIRVDDQVVTWRLPGMTG